MCENFHESDFSRKSSRVEIFAVLILRFDRGSRKLRKFGPCENFPPYGNRSLDSDLISLSEVGSLKSEDDFSP